MMRLLSRTLALGLAGLFLVSLVPAPAAANPLVPYCAGPPVVANGATNAVYDAAVTLCMASTGRVFPEASALSVDSSCAATWCHGVATDYVSFPEFQAGLRFLETAYPQYLKVHTVGESYGLCPTPSPGVPNPNDPLPECTGAKDHFPIYMLEITNFESPMPIEERQAMLFMLSIHGVEKGGREGGFRVLEDLVSDIGFATEPVQDGGGLPAPIVTPAGTDVQTYRDYLDFQRIFLLFPNADGWMHDELPYAAANPPSCGSPPNGVLFCRTNGHGTDLNRQAPTAGWQNPNRNVVGEPESIGYYNWMLQQDISWAYAIDIHGMLNHQNFGAIMMPAGALTPQEMQRSVRLAETLKDRLNNDPHFATWENLWSTQEQVDAQVCDAQGGGPDCFTAGALASAPLGPVGSSQFAEYYTVIDAIGYTDSGFNGDYFAQDSGLNAPGYDIEMAYNHITTESQYEGPGSVFNDFHVKFVREIVKSFMDAAALDVKISFETRGLRTAYVATSYVATSADDAQKTPGGWADQNPGDDLWDYGVNGGFAVSPARYFEDLKPFVRNGAEPGVLSKLAASQVTASGLASYDSLVIPGSAIKDLEANPARIQAVKDWVSAGGNLVLTDESLRFLDLAGITDKAVDSTTQYMGGVGITDLSLPVFYEYQDTGGVANVRGGVKQTYEPTPLGFETGANAAPIWGVDPAKFGSAKGTAWATACGSTNIADRCPDGDIALGKIALGSGQIQFIGALLPDPTEEFYHPYGLDPYATTYSGNQMLRNMLYWGNVFDNPPIVINDQGQIVQSANEPQTAAEDGPDAPGSKGKDSPGLEPVVLVGALAALAVVLRRRR